MNLSVFERINLLSVVPAEGNFATLKLQRKLREKLSFNEKENEALKFQPMEGGRITWNRDAVNDVEMEFTDWEMDCIKTELKKLDEKNKLKQDHYTLFIKFVGE